jgi:hypothetical protein
MKRPTPQSVWFGASLAHDIDSFIENGVVFFKTCARDPELHFLFDTMTCASSFQFEEDELPDTMA